MSIENTRKRFAIELDKRVNSYSQLQWLKKDYLKTDKAKLKCDLPARLGNSRSSLNPFIKLVKH